LFGLTLLVALCFPAICSPINNYLKTFKIKTRLRLQAHGQVATCNPRRVDDRDIRLKKQKKTINPESN
jgi:hypothetical protein